MSDADAIVQPVCDQLLALEKGGEMHVEDALWIQYNDALDEEGRPATTFGGWIGSVRELSRIGFILTRRPDAAAWIATRPEEG